MSQPILYLQKTIQDIEDQMSADCSKVRIQAKMSIRSIKLAAQRQLTPLRRRLTLLQKGTKSEA